MEKGVLKADVDFLEQEVRRMRKEFIGREEDGIRGKEKHLMVERRN